MMLLNVFVALVLLYSLVSGCLEKSVITAPLMFTIAGIQVSIVALGFQTRKIGQEVFLKMAELGLVLLFFTDANYRPGEIKYNSNRASWIGSQRLSPVS